MNETNVVTIENCVSFKHIKRVPIMEKIINVLIIILK